MQKLIRKISVTKAQYKRTKRKKGLTVAPPNGLWVSIDPGQSTGLAVWKESTLVDISVFHGTAQNWCERLLQVSRGITSYIAKKAYPHPLVAICAELPEYRDNRREVNAKGDLVKLTMGLGIIIAGLDVICATRPPIHLYKPSEWKGQMDADKTRQRVCSIMEEYDFSKLSQHEIDAIGVGLFRLGLI
jgi:hypothetical protein